MPPGAELTDRDQWLELRRTGVTASEIGVILGLSSWQSAFSLFWEKRGELADRTDDSRMALGRYMESYVAGEFSRALPWMALTRMGLARSSERPWQLATCDRLALPEPGTAVVPVELKTSSTFDGWGPAGSDVVPLAYRAQVLWQMDVVGADSGYVAALFLLTQETRVYEIGYDESDILVMREAAQEFLARVAHGDAPQIDGSAATRAALSQLYAGVEDTRAPVQHRLAVSYQAACRNYAAAEARKRLLENRLRAAMGEARVAIDARTGDKVATRLRYERAGYEVDATVIDSLRAARERKSE
jgi:putative phage-type endonuclease